MKRLSSFALFLGLLFITSALTALSAGSAPAATPTAAASTRIPTPFPHPHQDGYVLVLWTDYSDAAINGYLDRIKGAGSQSVTLPFFGCQTSITSADVGSCQVRRPAFTDVTVVSMLSRQNDTAVHIAQLAIAKGLSPIFLPIIATPKWDWRGVFDPTDPDAWFASYTTWMQTVAKQAHDLGMDELIVASEFSKLYRYTDQWKTFLGTIRQSFSNPLIVTVNWGQLDFDFWDEADAIGISEYYPLTNLDSPTQDDLDQGALSVKKTILSAAKKYHRPVFLTEVGFPSTTDCGKEPWTVDTSSVSNWPQQASCFGAFKKAWQDEAQLAHVGFWATGDSSTDSQYPMSYEVFGKPAEKILEGFFSERSHLN